MVTLQEFKEIIKNIDEDVVMDTIETSANFSTHFSAGSYKENEITKCVMKAWNRGFRIHTPVIDNGSKYYVVGRTNFTVGEAFVAIAEEELCGLPIYIEELAIEIVAQKLGWV